MDTAVKWDQNKLLTLKNYIKSSQKLPHTTKITWRGNIPIPFDVYKVPIQLLSYNFNNTRIRSELIAYLQKNHKELNPNDPEQIAEVQRILLASRWFSEMTTRNLMEDLKERGQLDTAVARPDGILIDGNRRLAIFRHYSKLMPSENFEQMEICVLPEDSTASDLKALEMRLQMAQEFKVGYGEINTALEFRHLFRDLQWDTKTIEEVTMGHYKEHKIRDMIRTIDIIDECLELYPPRRKNIMQYNILDKGWESFLNLMNLLKRTEREHPENHDLFKNIKLFGFQIIMNPSTTYADVRRFSRILKEKESRDELNYLSDTLKGKKLETLFEIQRMEQERKNLEYAYKVREDISENPITKAKDALKKIESIRLNKTRKPNRDLISIFNAIISKVMKLKDKIS